MRIPALLATAFLVNVTSAATQDLQFRTVATSEALGLALPGFTMNVAIKGQLTRIDMDVAGMWFSSIVDYGAQKMVMINHEEMSYSERNGVRQPEQSGSTLQFRATGERQEMAGLKVKRLLSTSILPGGATMVQEMWVADDARLGAAFRRYISALASHEKIDTSGHLFGDIPPGVFPVRITVVVVAPGSDEKVDANAVLKGKVPVNRIQMRMTMETSDIRNTEVDPSWFAVPAGYVKSSK